MPLKDGINDGQYLDIFRTVLAKVMEVYRPDAVVFQSGEMCCCCIETVLTWGMT